MGVSLYQYGDVPCWKDMEAMDRKAWLNFCTELLRRNGYSDIRRVRGNDKKQEFLLASRDGQTYAVRYRKPGGQEETGMTELEEVRQASAIMLRQEQLEEMLSHTFPDYTIDYYRAMKPKTMMGSLQSDWKIILMYVLLFAVFFFILRH